MAELRWHPLIQDWVMINSNRQNRPEHIGEAVPVDGDRTGGKRDGVEAVVQLVEHDAPPEGRKRWIGLPLRADARPRQQEGRARRPRDCCDALD